ncbi:MAG: hypothetical protein ACFCBU_05410, partial [Cyanophyceae cyanobacterium]
PNVWFDRGNALFLGKQLRGAVNSYDEALKLAPLRQDVLTHRSVTLTRLLEPQKALLDLRKVEELLEKQGGKGKKKDTLAEQRSLLDYCRASCHLLRLREEDCSEWERNTSLDRATQLLQRVMNDEPERYGTLSKKHTLFKPLEDREPLDLSAGQRLRLPEPELLPSDIAQDPIQNSQNLNDPA